MAIFPHHLVAAAAIAFLAIAPPACPQDVVEAEDVPPSAPVEMSVTVEMPELEAAIAEQNASATELSALRDEVTALRIDLKQLQETLDLLLNQIMADLETENLQLRDEVLRMHNRAEAGAPSNRNVPRPGGEVIDSILAGSGMAEGEAYDPGAAPVEDAPRTLPFLLVNEWGRSPEVAAELPGDVPSLVGIVGAVPPGSRRVDVEQLGRELRAKYADYDNINVEIFDDENAAAFYAETNVSDPAHRILSISKHAASGRDVILLLDNGVPTEVAF